TLHCGHEFRAAHSSPKGVASPPTNFSDCGRRPPIPTDTLFVKRLLESTRIAAIVIAVALVACALACGTARTPPPYPPGQRPTVPALLVTMQPRIAALQSRGATLRDGRGPSADLLVAAQAPLRLAAMVHFSGN